MGRKHNDVFRLSGEPIPAESDIPHESRSDPIDGEQFSAAVGSKSESAKGLMGRRARLGALAMSAGATAVAVGLALSPRGERTQTPPRTTSSAAPETAAVVPPPPVVPPRPVVPYRRRATRRSGGGRSRQPRQAPSESPPLQPIAQTPPVLPSPSLPLSGDGLGGRENFGIERG